MDTVNIGSHARCAPFVLRCLRGGPLSQEQQTPPIRARDRVLSMSGITFSDIGRSPSLHSPLDLHISNLTFNSTIHSFINQCIGHTVS
jgi:hypothetical protein